MVRCRVEHSQAVFSIANERPPVFIDEILASVFASTEGQPLHADLHAILHILARPREQEFIVVQSGEARVIEHALHAHHIFDIPAREVLVKARGAGEHVIHGLHTEEVPVRNILIEARGVLEHPAGVGDTAHIPTIERLIKARGVSKGRRHHLDIIDLPVVDVIVEIRGVGKRKAHVLDTS